MIPAGINPSALEQAYAFFHQKWQVYAHSTSEREMDHIEDVISTYADAMSPSLFAAISSGNPSFLHEHITFSHDLSAAISLMEEWM